MLEPNTVLQSRYLIVRKLAQGGMGAVYQATDQRFGSTVALKQMLVSGEQLRKAFEREARLLNNLRHRALPVVSDYFSEGDGVFLIMQFIPGEDLMSRLEENNGPFVYNQVMAWADQLLDALDYLHTHEPPIIHRDIKPQNLKLTPRGEIILLDFGLAKGSTGQTAAGGASDSLLGYTPTYAPLEQIQGAGTDARSDLYSLSATLYHLVTGAAPSDALTRTSALVSGLPDPLRPANQLNKEIPVAVAEVLTQAMALNRDHRPESATEMRNALKHAAQRPMASGSDTAVNQSATTKGSKSLRAAESATVVSSSKAGVASAQVTAEKKRPSPARWIAFVVVFIAAAVAAFFLIQRSVNKPASDEAIKPPANINSANTNTASSEPAPAPATPTVFGLPLKSFAFDVVTLDAKGAAANRAKKEAQFFSEDLGAGVMLDMVKIPGGTFLMGSPDSEKERFGEEGPQHNVEVQPFYMGKFEITQAQWQAVAALPKIERDLNPNPSNFEGVTRPVQKISFADAKEFCARLAKKTGRAYRLPSEAEWEYACRAGTTTPYGLGENINAEVANYDGREPYAGGPRGEYRKQTTIAGSFGVANAFGIFDMHGNMWEWVLDPWHNDYKGAPRDGSVWEDGGERGLGIVRGGSWNRNANNCRSAYRLKISPSDSHDVIGFRIIVPAPAK
jgi:eukaryotic-like serine/threonine-protein kinase